MGIVELVLAFLGGCVVTGIVAHRKPDLFNKAVTLVNAADAAANAKIASLKPAAAPAAAPPATPPAQ